MKFVTLFPEALNIHLVKDVGMIAYILTKYYGYKGTLACYRNSEKYGYLDKEVKGLNVDFLKKYTGNDTIDGLLYILKNAKNIDVLHIFHVTSRRNYAWILLYKVLNPQGKVYLKLDADFRIKDIDFHKKDIKSNIRRWILKKCFLISVETVGLYKYLISQWNLDIEYIPNGFYDFDKRKSVSYKEKENIICTVGRIGTKQKASEILLEAFQLVNTSLSDWHIKFIGPIDDGFSNAIEEFFCKYPKLKDQIIFTGNIMDREKLNEEYKKAKIFCLTSRWEGFPLVFPEAMKNGCYIITSDIEAGVDVIENGKYGCSFQIDDTKALAKCLVAVCHKDRQLEINCEETQKFVYEKFYWINIAKKIDQLLNKVG